MRRIEARRKKARPLRLRFSQSLASLRQRLSQAMVRSTIQRLGRTVKSKRDRRHDSLNADKGAERCERSFLVDIVDERRQDVRARCHKKNRRVQFLQGQHEDKRPGGKHTAIPGEIVTPMVVKGLIERDTGGHLALTDRGRAVLRAMLPDL